MNHRLSTHLAIGLVGVVGLAGLTACSSSDKSSTTKTGASAGGGAGGTLVVEGLGTITPPGGVEPFPGLADGAKARFERANRDHELKSTIKFLGVKDDQAAPDKNADAARAIVENDHAFAVVPAVSQALNGAAPYLNQKEIPFVGPGWAPPYCEQKFGFAPDGCLQSTTITNTSLMAVLGKALGGVKSQTMAIVAEDFTADHTNVKQVEVAAKAAGFDVVYAEASLPPAGAAQITDYSPYAHAILTSDHGGAPDIVVHGTSFERMLGLTAAIKQAGYKGIQQNFVGYAPGLLDSSPDAAAALDGSYVVSNSGGMSVFGGPSWDQVKKDLKAIGAPQTIGGGTQIGYADADFFIAVVKQLEKNGTTVTGKAFHDLVAGGFDYKGFGNVQGTASFPKASLGPAGCAAAVLITGKTYVPKVDLTCGFPQVPMS